MDPLSRSLLPRIEEAIRKHALEAFKGDLIPGKRYVKKLDEMDELKQQNDRLQETVKQKEEALGNAERENQMLKGLQAFVDGQRRTFQELIDWTMAVCGKEIERRVNEKFNHLVAASYGTIDWIHKKLTKKET